MVTIRLKKNGIVVPGSEKEVNLFSKGTITGACLVFLKVGDVIGVEADSDKRHQTDKDGCSLTISQLRMN